MRHEVTLTIPIDVFRAGPEPMHRQIALQMRAAVDHGLLRAGARLPSTRTLAALLGVSRGVATAAYDLLFGLGYLESRRGSGTYVARRRLSAAAGLQRVR